MRNKFWENWRWLIVIGGGAIFVVLGFLLINATEEHTVTLTSRLAVYTVPVEDYQPRQTGGWDETVPPDAYNRSAYEKQRGDHDIYIGDSCSGSGDDRRCSPMYQTVKDYDTWVDYTVDRWQWKRSVVNQFTSTEDTLVCPNPDVRPDCEGYGCERALACEMSYSISLKDTNGAWDCSVSLDQWLHMSGQYTLTVRRFFNQPYCDLLAKAATI